MLSWMPPYLSILPRIPTYIQRCVAPAVVHRSDMVEILAVVSELAAPLFRQDIVLLVLSHIARMEEERLTSAAILRADEGAAPRVATFLS